MEYAKATLEKYQGCSFPFATNGVDIHIEYAKQGMQDVSYMAAG